MSAEHQEENTRKSLFSRFCSLPRVQNVVNKSNRAMGNVLEKYNHGLAVSKTNAKDTLKEMGKFFSVAEAQAAINYTRELARDSHKELVDDKVRLLSS